MVGIHVEFRIKPDAIERFLEWKRLEGELQRRTAGFVKRAMHRSRHDPTHFFYVSYWRSKDEMHAFGQSTDFAEAFAQSQLQTGDSERILVDVDEVFDELGELPNG